MAVFKRKSGFKAEVFIDGRRVAIKSGFKNKTEAKIWHDRFKASYDPAAVKAERYRMEELLAKFEEVHLPTMKNSTAERYRIEFKYRIRPFFQYQFLDKLDASMIERYRTELMTGLSPKSVNNATATLRLILNKGVKWGMLVKNPFDLKALKIPERNYEWWERREDIQRFLAFAKRTQYYGFYLAALETGMRLGELVGLSKNDVSFDRLQIRVHRQWLDKEKCYGPCKANNVRTIPINKELAEVLRDVIELSRHEEAVFVTRTDHRVGARNLAGGRFPHLVKKAGVPLITFHGLRHTFASHYMINGGSIWDLKQILGHSDVSMTQRYAHLSARYLDASVVNWSAAADHAKITPPIVTGIRLVK